MSISTFQLPAAFLLGVDFFSESVVIAGLLIGVFVIGFAVAVSRFYRKVGPEEALVRTGVGNLKVANGEGIFVIPVLHRADQMDLSVKRIEIARKGEVGLICRDNIRADIEVAFFVRVNNTANDIRNVAQSLGCKRASSREALVELFDAKFSEALKTVGKHFDFVELYNERDKFKEEILKIIGTDLNGYVLDDCAIDYLEQTPLEKLSPTNILDAEGIKKITDLTAREHVLSNHITREKEKTIKKQDVEAQETILELERQRVEAVEKQTREIASLTAREHAEARRVEHEERLKAETARIRTDEELAIAEENKLRQVIVAEKSKQRTEAVETERVEKDRLLEVTERERVVGIADIEKDKAIEVEKRNIQEVIRERVIVERAVVEEEERIKDTHEFATADRLKQVTVTRAEMEAQENLVKEVKAAEAQKSSAELLAEKVVIEAEADKTATEKKSDAIKVMAEAKTADGAALGLADAQVMIAKATATEKTGQAEANVLIAKAEATEKTGTAEAKVMQLKYSSEATGIVDKAKAMKLFDGVGRDHEEFKIKINKEKDIELAAIAAQQEIAEAQAGIVGEALKSARIDIVGGETTFFDKIVDSIKSGKSIDRFVHNSETLTDIKNTFFNGNPDYFEDQLQTFISRFGMSFEDVKNLSIAALISQMLVQAEGEEDRSTLNRLLSTVKNLGIADKKVSSFLKTKVEK
ncbi:flotillin family protein [Gimesia sp.]|uniref:flotillin family protein n=1 Tax=Gimesia sp. TaxID=2024833 RepID=UPI000C40DB5B|nr:flotillin family protein [Gimesia sp.]MAX36207.1 flotillin [Gimesia sp.]HBL46665.1 flotillin [Planctomycetaceae bacterium]|tara:strand:+ start:16929 stop:19028 length:2100 start_codon:yes stop_codon:yes gene_type:complete